MDQVANQVADGASQGTDSASIESRLDDYFASEEPKKKRVADSADESTQNQTEDTAEEQVEDDVEQTDGEEIEEEQEAAPDVEEFELDGEVYEVPAKLKPLLMRHSHFTKLSEQVEVREKEVNQLAMHAQQKMQMAQQAEQYFGDMIGQIRSIDMSINQINQMTNWGELRATDPLEYSIRINDLNSFTAQRERLARDLEANKSSLGDSITRAEQAYKAQLTEEGNKYLSKKIKGWSPDMANSLGKYAINFGFSAAQVSELVNPLTVMLIHKAYLYDKGQQLSAKRGVPASPTIRPGAAPASSNVSSNRRYQDARSQLKRSGRVEDAVALLNM